MRERKNLRNYFRGWFPQEPLHKNFSVNSSPDPKRKAELDRKLAKHSSIVNPILVGTFLGTKTLLQPHYNNNIPAEVTALSFGIFLSALVGFNLLLYWHYKKQLVAKESK